MLEGLINVDSIPTLDLHGEIVDIARIRIEEFINDNILLKNKYISIIHGIGSGKIKEITKETLKNNKYVIEYKLCFFNEGMTLVRLDIKQGESYE